MNPALIESQGRISVLCPTCNEWSEWPSTRTRFCCKQGHNFTLRQAAECWPGGIAEGEPPREAAVTARNLWPAATAALTWLLEEAQPELFSAQAEQAARVSALGFLLDAYRAGRGAGLEEAAAEVERSYRLWNGDETLECEQAERIRALKGRWRDV